METKTILIGLVIGILIGAVAGYASAPRQAITQSQVDALQATANKVPGLESQVSTLTGQLTTANTEITSLKAQIPPIKKGSWNLVKTFTGVSDVNTDYFYVGQSEARMNYTFVKGELTVFSIFLYREGSGTSYTYANPFIQASDSTYIHGVAVGSYYLKVGAANVVSWKITVEVWVPA